MFLYDVTREPWFILIMIIVAFGVLVLAIILVKKFFINKNKKVEVNEEEARQEELNRILEPITDEETIKAMEEAEKK